MGQNMHVPTREEFCMGIEEYEKHEKRDSMYKVATFLVSNFWGKSNDMADALGILLLTWNQAFYRYGPFDFDKLEKCIIDNFQKLESFRTRFLFTLSDTDINDIRALFNDFLTALQINSGNMRGRMSPVSASKALHLLGPNFFPLWDDKIARAYKCYYDVDPAGQYISFSRIMKSMVEKVKDYIVSDRKSVLKLIDQYNYSKYTKQWI